MISRHIAWYVETELPIHIGVFCSQTPVMSIRFLLYCFVPRQLMTNATRSTTKIRMRVASETAIENTVKPQLAAWNE